MCVGRLRFASILAPVLVALAACSAGGGPGPSAGDADLAIRADVSGTNVAMVVVQVTGSDLPAPLVFNISITNGVASGTITVPAGSSRTITLRAYDAGGVLTHNGSATVTLQPGTNPTVSIILTPLTGDLPITVTLGAFVVTVAPALDSLGVSPNSLGHPATAQLTATIRDPQGNLVTGTVNWATLNPGVAFVNATGLVTATDSGTTKVAAVYQGVSGVAVVVVTR